MVAREKPCIEISVMSHIFPHQWEQPLLGTITYIIESFNIQVHVSVIFICLLYIKLSQWEGKDNSQPPTFSQFLIKQTITSIKLTKRFSASSKIFLGIHKKRKKKKSSLDLAYEQIFVQQDSFFNEVTGEACWRFALPKQSICLKAGILESSYRKLMVFQEVNKCVIHLLVT